MTLCAQRRIRQARSGDSHKPNRSQLSLNSFNVREMTEKHMTKLKVTVQTHNAASDQDLDCLLIGHSI